MSARQHLCERRKQADRRGVHLVRREQEPVRALQHDVVWGGAAAAAAAAAAAVAAAVAAASGLWAGVSGPPGVGVRTYLLSRSFSISRELAPSRRSGSSPRMGPENGVVVGAALFARSLGEAGCPGLGHGSESCCAAPPAAGWDGVAEAEEGEWAQAGSGPFAEKPHLGQSHWQRHWEKWGNCGR